MTVKNAKKALIQREQNFRVLCDVVPTLLWKSDNNGNCVYVNQRWIKFTGRTLDFALGSGWLNSIHPDDRERTKKIIMKAFGECREFCAEYRLRRADAQYRWVFDNGVPYYISENRFASYIGSCIDITERKQTEHHALQSDRRYYNLVQASPVGIFYTDVQGKCIYVNKCWREITGIATSKALGDGWILILHPNDRERIATELQTVHTEHGLFKSIYRFRRLDGRIIWVFSQLSKELDAETGQLIGYVGTVTDVTECKEVDQHQLQRRSELYYAPRHNVVGELAGTMAHQLSQPLTAITNYVEGAINRYQDPNVTKSELGDVLTHILKLTKRTTMIVRSMRALMSEQDSAWQPVNINALICDTVELIETEVEGRQVKITLDLATNIQKLTGDKVQLQQLLLNLFHNGLEAMKSMQSTKWQLTIQTRNIKDKVEIRVSDRGVGISEELVNHLFEPFVTSKPEGFGLGLSICRTIVEAHSGEISTMAHPGTGSCFCITLPMDRRRY